MLLIDANVVIWLAVWAFIGSTLGFFTIRLNPIWTIKQKFSEYLKSVCIGIFFSLPLYFVLQEINELSHNLSITLAGSSSFAITDLIIKLWPKAIEGIGKAINKFINNIGNKNNHE